MKSRFGRPSLLQAMFLTLAAAGCSTATTGGGAVNSGFIKTLPQSVVDLAGPGQDLTAVKLLPEDGCFWYRHVGPVETTLLPLRTAGGSTICTQAGPEPKPAGQAGTAS